MKTTTKLKLGWKYRAYLWKYRKLIRYRREIALAAAGALAVTTFLCVQSASRAHAIPKG